MTGTTHEQSRGHRQLYRDSSDTSIFLNDITKAHSRRCTDSSHIDRYVEARLHVAAPLGLRIATGVVAIPSPQQDERDDCGGRRATGRKKAGEGHGGEAYEET
ncbi:hypothetical protein KVT40_009260 [Elsinoe batatas]|uniref:Uncharacterized protein n=1 Tax=Elsinoe batatas TaxID=2601811 RepID=A0A8K0KZ84_9PEZI|nr:hypothetical protein KVT40_009260 [Elsinoe batatas]